jgi:hypothetical protein
MSFVPAGTPFIPEREDWWSMGSSGLAKHLSNASHFLNALRIRMRFGELTRAPLRLLRLQLLDEAVECDWIARSPDPWDIGLPGNIEHRHAALQALKDAIDVRALLFASLPQAETAHFRVFRESSSMSREMIITGYAERSDGAFRHVRSPAMRAKLLGFRFSLEDDVLHELSIDEQLCVGH